MKKRVAICVDDFGMHAGVNDAVFDLASRGRVQAVGCLVGAPAWHEGSERLRGIDADAVDVGLHLDFTEHPLRAGSQSPLRSLIVRAYARQLHAGRLRAEIDAQFDAFEREMRRPPAFIDGHQHVHQLPMIREALMDVLRERGRALRPWLRSTRRPAGSWAFKPWLIEVLGDAALRRQASAQGLKQNVHLLGVYDFQGDASAYRARLAGWLAAASDGDLLMCHPSMATSAPDAVLAARLNEYRVLADADLSVTLVTISSLVS